MGALAPGRKASTTTLKSKSDFSKLGPLKNQGTKGFSSYRDTATSSRKKSVDAMDSDEDEDDDRGRDDMEDIADIKDENGNPVNPNPEDLRRQGELAEGVRQIKVCTPALCLIPHH